LYAWKSALKIYYSDLWKIFDYHSFGIRGETILSFEQRNDDLLCQTDNGRSSNGKHSIRDVMRNVSGKDNPLYLNTTNDLITWLGKVSRKTLNLTEHMER
jgi:hypothetical protein